MAIRLVFNPITGWKGSVKSKKISMRELTMLTLIAQGYSYETIAEVIGVKHQTVKNNVSRLAKKLGAKNNVHALMKAIEAGMITFEIISDEMDESLPSEQREKAREYLNKEREKMEKMSKEEQDEYMEEQNMRSIRGRRKKQY